MKTIKPYLISLATAVAMLATAHRVPAQFFGQPTTYNDFYGGSHNNGMSALMATMAWNRVFYPKASGNAGRSTTSPSTATPASRPQQSRPTDDSGVRFHSTGTYIKTPEMADHLGKTPAEREQYLKLMNAALDGFGKQAAVAGFQNDLAMALSYFLAENIRIYRGLPELSDQQYVNLRNVIAEVLVSGGALNKVTDRQKQEFYEALVAYTGVTQFGYEQAKQAGNDQMVKGYQQVAGQSFRTVTKMSPDSMNLTTDGLTANPPE